MIGRKILIFDLRDKSSTVKFRMAGGIGNQLFIYAAGIYYEFKTGKNVVFDFSKKDFGGRKHPSDIRFFIPEGKFTNNKIRIFYNFILHQIQRHLGIKIPRLATYISPVVGHDENLLSQKNIKHIQGYFQSFRYIDEPYVNETFLKMHFSSENPTYLNLLAKVKKLECIGVHVRRGDYHNYKNYIGMLASEYYLNAIEKINLENNTYFQKIYFYTDDVDGFQHEFAPKLADVKYEIVSNSDLTAEETLMLMSNHKHLVISNSSFSWWAAKLGASEKEIVAPNKWFIAKEDPEHLIPDKWKTEVSIWVE